MGFKQSSSRRGSGQKFRRTAHDKKAKGRKQRSGREVFEEEGAASAQQVVAKTLASLNRLGNQTFALSPFSQYFDDWLVALRQVVSEFESSPDVSVDELFVKERTIIFTGVERELAQRRFEQAALDEKAHALAEANHLLVQLDYDYATTNRENNWKRNREVEGLTKNVHDLEDELENCAREKTRFFSLSARRAKAEKQVDLKEKLQSAKSELEVVVQNFTVEQEKLHDEYEKKKQATITEVRRLEKEIENIETDTSLSVRQVACKALGDAVNAVLQRSSMKNSL